MLYKQWKEDQTQTKLNEIMKAADRTQTLTMWIKFNKVPAYIGVADKELADQAAKEAAQHEEIDSPIPNTDYLHILERQFTKRFSRASQELCP